MVGRAAALRREVRRILGEEVSRFDGVPTPEGLAAQGRALGMAQGLRYFAPAAGRKLVAEVEEVIRGSRSAASWRRLGRVLMVRDPAQVCAHGVKAGLRCFACRTGR